MDNEIVYSAQEVADLLKIKKNTVYNMIKRGELSAYRVGNKMRISNKEVERYKRQALSSLPREPLHEPVSASEPYGGPYLPPVLDEPVQRDAGFIICGQDAALDALAKHLQIRPGGNRVLRSYVGSYNGLYMLYQGQVSVATAHLWDGKRDLYNIPYVEHMLPGMPAVIIHLFHRMQGFYVAKGNPKNMHSWEDLKRPGLTVINREKGSGSRVLLDERLRMAGVSPRGLPGYYKECFSHLAVASAVARGSADFGIGVRSGSRIIDGVDFVPLQEESYDMILRKEDLGSPMFQAVLQILRSDEFRMELEEMKEYDLTDLGRIIAET